MPTTTKRPPSPLQASRAALAQVRALIRAEIAEARRIRARNKPAAARALQWWRNLPKAKRDEIRADVSRLPTTLWAWLGIRSGVYDLSGG